jgi:hypothetical protein
MRVSTSSWSARWVGKWYLSDPVLTPARDATARTLSFAAGSSPNICMAARRTLSRLLSFAVSCSTAPPPIASY